MPSKPPSRPMPLSSTLPIRRARRRRCLTGRPEADPDRQPQGTGLETNAAVIASMAELGIDIANEYPKPWTDEIARAADVIVTMGCGDACPNYPGKRYEDWELDDPADQPLDVVRGIRDDLARRVGALLAGLELAAVGGQAAE